MMSSYSSKHPSFFKLWWRRQLFSLRRRPSKWFVLLIFIIPYLIITLPNPFSPEYTKLPINQNVPWTSINDILETKENILYDNSISQQIKIVKRGNVQISSTKPIVILLYTAIFQSKKYCNIKAERIFGETCPSKDRCEWTCSIRRLHEADAIIFHGYDMQYFPSRMPKRSDTKLNTVWILWSDEPPTLVDYALFKSYKFNWTISFKTNSEVSIGSYGLFARRQFPRTNTDYSLWVDQQFHHRMNSALWFVSNCDALERLDLYYNLRRQENTSVEGYGRCVDYYPMHLCRASSQCEKDYMSKYKFYLSFESMTCRDYITEKFFKAFYYGLIPIVYGPDRIDYERLVPAANSFIHINDFKKDMTQLANYLQEIHQNFTLFSMYHQWRKTYDVVIDAKALERIRMCELCQRLSQLRHGDMTYYEDINEFYHEKC